MFKKSLSEELEKANETQLRKANFEPRFKFVYGKNKTWAWRKCFDPLDKNTAFFSKARDTFDFFLELGTFIQILWLVYFFTKLSWTHVHTRIYFRSHENEYCLFERTSKLICPETIWFSPKKRTQHVYKSYKQYRLKAVCKYNSRIYRSWSCSVYICKH